jgi:CBS domain containing-hemolysin-like protein
MTWLWAGVPLLVVLGSVLAVAEASIGRMSRVRAMALREGGYANAGLLERIEQEPAHFLNAIYLAALLVQNGSAVLVAILAERHVGGVGIPLVSVAFTLAYFIVVEAMCKTWDTVGGLILGVLGTIPLTRARRSVRMGCASRSRSCTADGSPPW